MVSAEQKETFARFLEDSMQSLVGERRAQILSERCGLRGTYATLQQIANDRGMTRSRAQQICSRSARCLSIEPDRWKEISRPLADVMVLFGHFGVLSTIAEALRVRHGDAWRSFSAEGYLRLMAEASDDVALVRKFGHDFLVLAPMTVALAESIAARAQEHLKSVGEPVEDATMSALIARWWHDYLPGGEPHRAHATQCLLLRADLCHTDGRWHLAEWRWVVPTTKTDRIYALLREHGKPLHYSRIADIYRARYMEITNRNIHSGLGARPDLFALVGPGTYALAEWGLVRVCRATRNGGIAG